VRAEVIAPETGAMLANTLTSRTSSTRWVVLVVMCAGYFLVLLDVTIVNVALPAIASDLQIDVTDVQWVVDGYAIALACLLLAGGTIGDRHGHKRVVLCGLVTFGMASLACGLAPGGGTLIGARVGQGAGAALALPGTLAIISRAFPGRGEQARAIGIWAGVGSMALPAGPVLGGALAQSLGWRACFFINVPIVFVATLVAARLVAESRDARGRRLDWAGVLLGGGIARGSDLRRGATRAGRQPGGPGVCTGRGTAACVPGHGSTQSRADTAAGVVPPAGVLGGQRGGRGHESGHVGPAVPVDVVSADRAAPFGVGRRRRDASAVRAAVCARPSRRSAYCPRGPRLPMAAGLLVAAAGVALLGRLHTGSGYGILLAAMLLWGTGLGLLTPAVVAAAMGLVPAAQAGLASGVNNTARQAGGAIGIAIFGALAGSATAGDHFVAGMQLAGLITAGLFLAAAVATVVVIPHVPPAR